MYTFLYIKVDKSYEGLLQFPVTTLQATMMLDATDSTHPLTNRGKIFNYADIRTMFTSITYDKGGSVLRMIHNIMGDEKFQTVIREYLRKHAYATAQPEDLFVEIEIQYPGQFVTEIFSTFTEQEGVPIVTAQREGNTVTLSQKRFRLKENTTSGTEQGEQRWSIPITYTTDDDGFDNTLNNYGVFKRHESTYNFTIPEDAEFYVLNVQQFGYYRVNYDEENWKAIGRKLKTPNFGNIHVVNRAQIIDDLFQLARTGALTYEFIFDIVDFVRDDTHYLPWLATFNGLSYLQQRIPNDEYKQEFYWFMQYLLEPLYKHAGYNSIEGTHLDKLNRINILNWACKYNVMDCNEKAQEEFEKVQKGELVHPDLTPAVFCSSNRETDTAFDAMWQLYLNSNFATEQANLLTALGCTKNPMHLEQLLRAILTDSIRLHDKSATYAAAYQGNVENVDIVLDFIINNSEAWKAV